MQGISATTGKELGDLAHLRQSLADLLTTPKGSRVARHDYGCGLFELIDAPTNAATLAAIRAEVAAAVDRWEPRFRLTQVRLASVIPGRIVLDLVGEYLPNGQLITLDGIAIK